MTRTRITVLDGWRGIAILMVLVTHSAQWALSGPPFEPLYLLGKHGVGIFFVLSGFLITRTLLSSPINLRHFYTRRMLRLMPSAWVFLAVVLVVCLADHETPRSNILSALMFCRNYIDAPGHFSRVLTGHFWSLSVEEQFYLAWPLTLYLFGSRKSLWIAGAGFALCSAWVLHQWSYYAIWMNGHRTEACAPCLLSGCILALTFESDAVRTWFARHARRIFWPALLLYVFEISSAPLVLLPPIEAIAIALMLGATIARPFTILELAPLTYVGRISYSLYIWQGLFLMPRAGWLGILLVIPAGILAHELIEMRGLQLHARRRLGLGSPSPGSASTIGAGP